MAPVEVYRAGAWHELLACKDRWLGEGPPVIVIPSDQEKSATAALFPETAAGAVVTISGLMERYVKGLGKAGLISRQGLEMILGSIISEALTAYLNMEEYRQGYVRALTDFLYNYRSATLADLEEVINSLKAGRLTPKEKELIRIDAACRQRMGDIGFDLRSAVEHLLHSGGPPEFDPFQQSGLPEKGSLIFWGFDTVTPLEAAFIGYAFDRDCRVVFLHCADGSAPEQALRVQRGIAALLEREGTPPAVELKAPPGPGDCFTALSRSLFQPAAPPIPCSRSGSAVNLLPAARFDVLKANDRFGETVSIARRIRELLGEGASPDSIRIIAPAYDLYAVIIREVFPDYGIPFVLEEGIPLLSLPQAALINNLVGHSVSANPFALREKILSSPYVSYELTVDPAALTEYQKHSGAELLAAAPLRERLSSGMRCRLDFRAISRLRRTAYRSLQPAAGTHPAAVFEKYFDGTGSGKASQEDRFQVLLQSYLLDRAEKEFSLWRPRMSPAEFKKTLHMLMRRFRIGENIDGILEAAAGTKTRERYIRERDGRALERIELILNELEMTLLPLSQGAAERFPLTDLVRIFTRLLAKARLPDSFAGPEGAENRGSGVSVQGVDRGRYQRWDHTFICSLVDGEFPGAEEFNFLQPRQDGLGAGRTYNSVDLARNRFYQIIRSTTRGLCLSLPRSCNGRKLSPSPLLAELEPCLPPPAEAEKNCAPAPEGKGTLLYSRREKLLAIAGRVDHDYAGVLPLLEELQREDREMFDRITAVMRFDGLSASGECFCEFDGLFDPAGPALLLLKDVIGGIAFTPEILERYAACPLRFFFDDILGLKEEPDYHPDRTARGAAICAILKEYTAAICAGEAIPGQERAAQLLHAMTARYFERKNEAEPPDAFQARFQRQLVAGLSGAAGKRPGLFHAFLKHEAEGPDLLEPGLANLSGTVELGAGLSVGVVVDRVDMTGGGAFCFLYCYTTGPGDPRRIRRGLRFDLPLMLLLYKKFACGETSKAPGPFAGFVPAPAGGAGLYLVKSPTALQRGSYFAGGPLVASRRHLTSPKSPVFSGQRGGLVGEKDFAAALESVAGHIRRLHRLMKRGVFHPPLCKEAEQSCANCTFGSICRKDQARLDRLGPALRGDREICSVRELF